MVAVIVLAALALLLFVFVAAGVRIVRPFQRGIVERLGRYKETVDPGLRIIIPLIEHLRLVDMREQVVDVPPQEVITKDNVVVSVDAVVYYEPTDAQRLVYNVANFMLAVTKLAQTNLRNLVGDLQLDEALTSRDQINNHLRQILDDATDSWGVRVKRVELQRIDPPPDVMHSMHEQMKAERTRRAVVLTASGEREAAIARAQGERSRRSSRPKVFGSARSSKPKARPGRSKRWPRPSATARSPWPRGRRRQRRACSAASTPATPHRISSRSSTSRRCRRSRTVAATKIYLPADTSSMMGSLAGVAELFRNAGDRDINGNGDGDDDVPMLAPPPPPPRRSVGLGVQEGRSAPAGLARNVTAGVSIGSAGSSTANPPIASCSS